MRIPGLGDVSPIDLGKQSIGNFLKHDMTTYAAALSYAILFALFPFLIFLISLLSVLDLQSFFDWMLEQAQSAFPADAYQRFSDIVTQLRSQQRGGLLSIGVIAAIWGASGGVRSLMNALNVTYDVEETRSMVKRYGLSVLYTIGIAVLMVAATALMLLGPDSFEWLADQVGMGQVAVTIWTILRFPVLIAIMMIVCALVYYVGPNVDQPFRLISPGAVVAVVVWLVASIGFSIYVSNFGNYNATYGSLGGVIVLLLYFYLSCAVLLLGAEINAELHRQVIGEPEPGDSPDNQDDAAAT
ncbi:MAG TPA: YihY/virulence factor BrkB family protein [Thermomicrobiales bacterium]|nr:YihY/virulence factor BrkB family protein [Thermomicrobiales bacterium]